MVSRSGARRSHRRVVQFGCVIGMSLVAAASDPIADADRCDRLTYVRVLSPPCPACGKPVPFLKTQWGLGKPFICDGCRTELVIPKNLWIGLAAFVSFWMLKDRMDSPFEVVLLIAGLAAAVLILSRFLLIPRRARSAFHPIVLKMSKLTTQRSVFGNNDSDQSCRLNHCCVERPIKIRLLLTKTRGRLFQHNTPNCGRFVSVRPTTSCGVAAER